MFLLKTIILATCATLNKSHWTTVWALDLPVPLETFETENWLFIIYFNRQLSFGLLYLNVGRAIPFLSAEFSAVILPRVAANFERVALNVFSTLLSNSAGVRKKRVITKISLQKMVHSHVFHAWCSGIALEMKLVIDLLNGSVYKGAPFNSQFYIAMHLITCIGRLNVCESLRLICMSLVSFYCVPESKTSIVTLWFTQPWCLALITFFFV